MSAEGYGGPEQAGGGGGGGGGGGSGAPTNARYLLQQANGSLTNAQAMGALATGLVKNATTTGVQSIAVADTDYATPSGVVAYAAATYVPLSRTVSTASGLGGGGALSGNLTLTNDVITGKAGGQTWAGGTGANENVTITSTTHATKGTIRLDGTTTQINGVTYVWPGSQGAAGSALLNDGAGILSWSTSFLTAPPVVIDATSLTTTVPVTIRNAKSQSGLELQATLASSTGATGYCLLDSGAVRRGYIGLATAANNWITGTLTSDVVIEAISTSVRIRGNTAVHLSSPSNNFNVTTSGYLRLDDSVGSQFGFTASNLIVTTSNMAYTVGAAAAGSHIFAHNLVKTATAGTIAGIQLSTFSVGPSSGSAAIRVLDLSCTVNQTGSASGAVTGIYLAVTETAVLGTHDLIHLKAGATATTTMFKVDNAGGMQTATAVLATSATTGFWLCRTMAGTPTGAAPDGSFVLDTTAGKWWGRTGGAWKGVVLS